ncbi:MAG: LURP-one-related family protein [Marmoricola sp.]
MGLRDRRENRRRERSEFGAGGSAARYQMRQKLVSFGDDYWIENGDGDRVLRVDGKVLRVRKTLDIEDVQGTQLCRIQTRVLHIRDTMVIEDPDGEEMAKVHKALITPLRERWKVDVADGPDLEIQGNILDHEYDIEVDGRKVAEVSKKWFRVRDTYGVQIAPEGNTLLILAVAVALDVMGHPGE